MGETYCSGQSVNRFARPKLIVLALATSVLLVITGTALAATGDLTQPAGTAGCVSEGGSGGTCADGHALFRPLGLAVSPDGKSVYVASSDSDAVARFARNPTTGAITQPAGTAGCISETGTGPCADGHGLRFPNSVAVSADGKSVYVASSVSEAVARLNRNPTTGAISQPAGTAGCISDTGAGPCADGHALGGATGLAVSPDGKSVYVASHFSNAVARLNRDTTTGAISQPAGAAGCISENGGPCADGNGVYEPFSVAVSPDGKSVYVASSALFGDGQTGAVVRFIRNTTTGSISQPAGSAGCISERGTDCADGHGLGYPQDVTVSPDGKNVYVASFGDAVARLDRNTTTGSISQPAGTAGCISQTGAGPCAGGHALDGSRGVAVSADGKSVYIASFNSDAVARLNRNTTTGAITQPVGSAGCVSQTGAGPCADGHGLDGPQWVALSPDGKSVYVASYLSNAVARFNRAP
jgi:DNA-binding beta-propeller fold protein YncE